MNDTATQLEAAAVAAESSTLDPHGTIRVLVAEVRKIAADIKPARKADDDDDAPKARKSK